MTRLIHDVAQLKTILGIDFSDEQLAAIQAPADRPSVIVAGAGSGKTTVMAARVVWLVGHEEIMPSKILGMTFTRKAAGELSSRIRRALAKLAEAAGIDDFEAEYGEPTISTYDSFAGQLIDEFGILHGIESDVRLETDVSRNLRALRVARSYDKQTKHLDWWNVDSQILALDSNLNAHLASIDDLRDATRELIERYESQSEAFDARVAPLKVKEKEDAVKLRDRAIENAYARLELLDLVERYREAKSQDLVAEFSDQMARGAQLAIENADVQAAMRERFSVVMLDEYQDTSGAQGKLLQALFADGRAVTAVGDPMQNIYGWRGAAAATLARFVTDFPKHNGEPADIYHLTVARRSDTLILETANAMAHELLEQDQLVKRLKPRSDAARGTVTVSAPQTESEELDLIVKRIFDAQGRGIAYGEMAVLVRSWGPSVPIVAALRRAGIPVEIVGLPGLLNQPEIIEVVSLLQAASFVTANKAVARLLTNPRWQVGPRDLALLAGQLRGFSSRRNEDKNQELRDLFYQAIDDSDPSDLPNLVEAIGAVSENQPYSDHARKAFADLSHVISEVRKRRNDPIGDQIQFAISSLGLDVELRLLSHGQQALENLAAFDNAAREYIAGAFVPTMKGFLDYLETAKEESRGLTIPSPSMSDSVKITSIHAAKGLEWQVVFVPWMVGSIFPTYFNKDDWHRTPAALLPEVRLDREPAQFTPDLNLDEVNAHLDQLKTQHYAEERRLLYVAITRAARELHLSTHWFGDEGGRAKNESAFFGDLLILAQDNTDISFTGVDRKNAGKENPNSRPEIAWPLNTGREAAHRELAEAVLQSPSKVTDENFAQIDHDIDLLLSTAQEQAAPVVDVPLPVSVATTSLIKIHKNPEEYAQRRYRPLPIKPNPAARRGTRFHEWVANYYSQGELLDRDSVMSGSVEDGDDLETFKAQFLASEFANRIPVAVEVDVHTSIGGHLVRAQIDAVFPHEDGFWVVDWKTNQEESADPLQLAVYRLAWAEHKGISVDKVRAGFFYVGTGNYVEESILPDRAGIEEQLATSLKS